MTPMDFDCVLDSTVAGVCFYIHSRNLADNGGRALGCASSSAFSSVPPTPTPHLRGLAADPGPVLSALQVSVTHMPSDCIVARIFRAMAGSRFDVDFEWTGCARDGEV